MFTIHVVSDIHIECNNPQFTEREQGLNSERNIGPNPIDVFKVDADMLILAGDVGHIELWEQYKKFIYSASLLYKYVILIPGNHEYYNNKSNDYVNISKVDERLKYLEQSISNLYVLNNNCLCFDQYKVVIFGSILWSHIENNEFPKDIPIFNLQGEMITPIEWNYRHYEALLALENCIQMAKSKDYQMIVVTHYAPTYNGTLRKEHDRPDNNKNSMYCSKLEKFLESGLIKLWIYGHTGFNGRYTNKVGTQIYTNQYVEDGYKPYDIITINKN